MPVDPKAHLDPASIEKLRTGNDTALYYWMFGADQNSKGKDDLVIWL